MKFTDGYWHMRKGVTFNYPVEIRNVRTFEDKLTVLASCKKIVTRGDTLNTAILTVHYTSPMPDVICVELVHHDGKLPKGPNFEKAIDENVKVSVENGQDTASFTSGKLSVQIHKNDGWNTEFIYDGKRLTGSGYKSPGHIKTADELTYMREQLDLSVGEYIYGLGERFTPFVKNGQVVDLWNEDGGTCSEQAYKNIPFYLSNYGYGIFVDHPEKVSYEVGSEQVAKVQFSVPGESLKYYIIGGASLKEVLGNYTKLTGKPALPPAWSYGLWLTTSFTTSYDETTVNSFIDGMLEREIPLHVFHFDCFWMKEFQWCDFEWDRDVFPDPQGMLNRLKSKGLNICVWINSYIAQQSYLFEEGRANGYLVKTKEGDVWQWDRWQGGMGLVDFTNPAAVRWYKDKLKALIEMGVDSFKTDFGERIPTDVVYFDGSDPVKMHNYYTHLYNKAVFEVLEETKGKNEAMVFARSATAGGQQFPVHWGGDCTANYNSMAETLRGGLSLGLSGFGFWSHDISGFENTATPDLYKRWTAFGLLSSHSRLHGSQSYRVPWLFDDEASDVLRYFTKLKATLMPYMFASSIETTQTGLPMMRAMMLEFPGDAACEQLDRQYMLGESLLVAPIFNDRSEAKYYLPEGRWTNFLSGTVVEGGRWVNEQHDYFSVPLMVRPNSLIAVGSNELRPDYDYADGVVIHAFELEEGNEAKAAVYNTKAEQELEIRAVRNGNSIEISASGAHKPWEFIVRGVSEVTGITGADWSVTDAGIRLIPEALNGQIHILL